MIGFGTSLFSAGYVIYSFSTTFLAASIGFIILGFFSSFANTGFQTFFQTSIPSHQIGRIGTTLSLFQSSMLIVTILLAGLLSEVYGVKYLVIGTTLIIAIIAALLCALTTISHFKQKGSILSTDSVKGEHWKELPVFQVEQGVIQFMMKCKMPCTDWIKSGLFCSIC